MKNALLSLVAILILASCSSTPPMESYIGKPIDKVITAKNKAEVSHLYGGIKKYDIKQRTAYFPALESCLPVTKAGEAPICTPGFETPATETTTSYFVNEKGIITNITKNTITL